MAALDQQQPPGGIDDDRSDTLYTHIFKYYDRITRNVLTYCQMGCTVSSCEKRARLPAVLRIASCPERMVQRLAL
jgi:hypothetical protein